MILITGPVASGKRTYTEKLGYTVEQMSADVHSDSPVIYDVQEAVRAFLANNPDKQAALDELMPLLLNRDVVITTEVGSGVIPLEYTDRLFRETAGRLTNELALHADEVIRMVWGIPQTLKRIMRVTLVRHGKTQGNLEKRYNGSTDEPLCEEGEECAREASVRDVFAKCETPVVFVSPLLRARQTASILYPRARQIVVDGLQEMDFGDFEGRTACEMITDDAYIAWVNSGAEDVCPNGESRAIFMDRVVRAFKSAVTQACEMGLPECIIVGHGGTIMCVMDALVDSEKSYFEWHVQNCVAVKARCDMVSWTVCDVDIEGGMSDSLMHLASKQ
ncbi:MAG: hypothetical protein E7003_01905 [Eggerthellaceae bacterium]|nr:hypothetical protein [Eggerthellaceae bacterium]